MDTLLAVLLTTDQLDSLAEKTLRELPRLAPFQRDQVVERLLRADSELKPLLPELLSVYWRKGARRLPPPIRDSVSH
jgi:hypothetical protein